MDYSMSLGIIILLVVGAMAVSVCSTFVVTRAYDRQRALAALSRQMAHDHWQFQQRLRTLESQLGAIGDRVLPITTAFQALLVQELTHFHEPRTDALLTKLGPPITLTDAEEAELLHRLRQREVDMGHLITPSERDAARILPLIMKRIRAENDMLGQVPPLFQLVTIVRLGEDPSDASASDDPLA